MNERHTVLAKTLKGFGGGSVVEMKAQDRGNAYRAVYTVRFAEAVYVLHAFHKKSKAGTKTPKPDMDLVEKRLKDLIEERQR